MCNTIKLINKPEFVLVRLDKVNFMISYLLDGMESDYSLSNFLFNGVPHIGHTFLFV